MAWVQHIFLSTPSARRATGVTKVINETAIFLSTPSARRATDRFRPRQRPGNHFYPRPPRGGRLHGLLLFLPDISISIHALREEGDGTQYPPLRVKSNFYPRPPRGGRPFMPRVKCHLPLFLSTPSARRATQQPERGPLHRPISIHALREEGDQATNNQFSFLQDFYPRPPRGGRPVLAVNLRPSAEFLSTPSARRATAFAKLLHMVHPISIHALREEGDQTSVVVLQRTEISIHALREEGDMMRQTASVQV